MPYKPQPQADWVLSDVHMWNVLVFMYLSMCKLIDTEIIFCSCCYVRSRIDSKEWLLDSSKRRNATMFEINSFWARIMLRRAVTHVNKRGKQLLIDVSEAKTGWLCPQMRAKCIFVLTEYPSHQNRGHRLKVASIW